MHSYSHTAATLATASQYLHFIHTSVTHAPYWALSELISTSSTGPMNSHNTSNLLTFSLLKQLRHLRATLDCGAPLTLTSGFWSVLGSRCMHGGMTSLLHRVNACMHTYMHTYLHRVRVLGVRVDGDFAREGEGTAVRVDTDHIIIIVSEGLRVTLHSVHTHTSQYTLLITTTHSKTLT